MARTTLNAQTPLLGAYPVLPIAAGAADIDYTGTGSGTSWQTQIVEGKTIVAAKNTDTISHTITFTSVPDPNQRVGDIVYLIGPGKESWFGQFSVAGWASGGELFIDVSDATIGLAVITQR